MIAYLFVNAHSAEMIPSLSEMVNVLMLCARYTLLRYTSMAALRIALSSSASKTTRRSTLTAMSGCLASLMEQMVWEVMDI